MYLLVALTTFAATNIAFTHKYRHALLDVITHHSGPVQEFAHPQARFLHEKQRMLSPRARRWCSGLLAAVNKASFKAIDGAMFVGTVRTMPVCHV